MSDRRYLKHILFFALIAGVINALPILLFDGSSDLVFRYTLIHCFSSEFWQGDLYPRWCSDAYAGLGAPLFLFYFPLPYYITSLFYPLHYLGLPIQGVYFLSILLCNILSFLAAWRWLREVTDDKSARLTALLFLWMPYRMEMMMFRSAFTELWCLAFVPLLFLYTRRIAYRHYVDWPKLAAATACCLLSQVFSAAAALLGCGIYIMLMTGKSFRPKRYFAMAMLLAALVSLFYVVPSEFFLPYSNPDAWKNMRLIWIVDYFDFMGNLAHGRLFIDLNLILTVAALIGLGSWLYIKSKSKEIAVWGAVAMFGTFALFEISAPFWDLIGGEHLMSVPYRMQTLQILALTFFLAIIMPRLTAPAKNSVTRADYWILLGGMMFLATTMGSKWTDEQRSIFNRMTQAHHIPFYEYVSRWTDLSTVTPEKITARAEHTAPPHAAWSKGKGSMNMDTWNSRELVFSTKSASGGELRLEHFYFPIWQVSIDDKPQELLPEEHSGKMLLKLPAGEHTVSITRNAMMPLPMTYRWAVWLSYVALMLLSGWLTLEAIRRRDSIL